MSDSFAAWLHQAGRRPLLTHQEVMIHARSVQGWLAGDIPERIGQRSMNRLIECNMRLVVNVFRRKFSYINTTDRRALDLLQDGVLGLRHAITKFDPARGYRFSTYAVNWIYKYMDDSVRGSRMVRLSADCQSLAMSARRKSAAYMAEHGKPPSYEWLAEALNKPVKTVKTYLEAHDQMGSVCSLNKAIHDPSIDELELMNIIPSPEPYDMAADRQGEKLNQVLQIIMSGSGLTDREKELIAGRFLNSNGPDSWSSLEKETGVNQRNAPAMVKRALARCTKTAEKYGLDLEDILSAS